MTHSPLAQAIYTAAQDCGFDNCGIIPLTDLEGFQARYDERLERIPQSGHFYRNVESITQTPQQFPWAKSMIVLTTWLGKYRFPASLEGLYGKAFLLSASSDRSSAPYQEKLRFEQWLTDQGLRWAGGDTCGHTKVGPMRYAAVQAGLGIFRKNNFFYTEKGSWVELEGYVIDRECTLKHTCSLPPCPDGCTLCQRACPTRALCAPYTMNPLACVSFWNTFGGGNLPPQLPELALGQWLCGCDACQDACPHNRHDWSQGEPFPGLEELADFLQPESLLEAATEELAQRACPKSADHIVPQQAETFRVNAQRVLHNRAAFQAMQRR